MKKLRTRVENGVRVYESPVESWDAYFGTSKGVPASKKSPYIKDEDEEADPEYNLGPLDAGEEEELPQRMQVKCRKCEYAIPTAAKLTEATGFYPAGACITDLGRGLFELSDIDWQPIDGGASVDSIIEDCLRR